MFRLLIEDDEGRTTIVPLIRNQINIGREEGNTIRLTERNVSRRHARLALKDGQIFIEDLQSYNGVWINGSRVQGKSSVQPGDLLEIGDYHLSVQEEVAEVDRKARPSLPPEQDFDENTPPLGIPAIKSSEVSAAVKPSRLMVLNTQYKGHEFLLTKPEMSIGRTEDNDITIDHASVSRHHAKVKLQGEAYQLVDLGSANGVQVNGEEYGVCDLRWGDIIELGQVRIRFASSDDPLDAVPVEQIASASAPAPAPPRNPLPILLALVVLLALVGGAIFVLTSNNDPDPKKGATKKGIHRATLPPAPQEDLNTPEGQEKIFKRAEDANAQEEYEEALKLLNKLLTVRSEWGKVKELKKRVLHEKKNLQHILRAKGLKVEGDLQGAYKRLGKVEKDSRYYSRALSKRKELLPALIQELMDKATRSMGLKRYDEAIQFTDEILQLKPGHPGALAMHKNLKKQLDKTDAPPKKKRPLLRNAPRRRRIRRRRPRRRRGRKPRLRTRRKAPPRRRASSGGYGKCLSAQKKGQFKTALKCFQRWAKGRKIRRKQAIVYVYMGVAAGKIGRCGKRKGRLMLYCVTQESYYRNYLKLRPTGAYAKKIRAVLGDKPK